MTSRGKGIACIISSAFGFALMALAVRLCDDYGQSIGSFQKSFFRNAIAFVIAAAIFLRSSSHRRGLAALGSWHSVLVLLLRSIAGTAGIFAHFYALGKIPIADAQTLNKTAPFFTVLFAWIFLGERMSKRQVLCLAAAFAGVLFVAKPGFGAENSFALAVALFGGVFAGGAYACIRKLAYLKVDSALIVLVFSAFSSLSSVPFMAVDFTPMTVQQVCILTGAGVAASLGQFGITAAYRHAPPGSIAIYDYTNIVFTALLGFAFLGQIPDFWSVLGFAVIVMSALKMR